MDEMKCAQHTQMATFCFVPQMLTKFQKKSPKRGRERSAEEKLHAKKRKKRVTEKCDYDVVNAGK